MAFSLESVTVNTTTSVFVKFTEPVVALDPGGSTDAQNPNNYTLVGPAFYQINSVLPVSNDPNSVQITFKTPLVNGQWALFVANILAVSGAALSSPTNLFFIVASGDVIAPPALGSNDTSYDILRKHFNKAFQGPGWTSVLKGIASGLDYLTAANEYAFQQSFIATATGSGLANLAASQGVTQFPNLGINDELFRELTIEVTNGKLTENAYLQVLKIFFGIDAVQASATSALSEPFNLTNGYTLTFNINDNFDAVITFDTTSFENITQASAQEVASVITQQLENQSIPGYAVVFVDPETGVNKVRIYSEALGLISSVTVNGGLAQNVFQFPSKIVNLQVTDQISATSSAFSPSPSPGYVRYWLQPNSGLVPETNLSLIQPGDYIIVNGGIFPSSIQGSFPIVNVVYNSAESVYVDVASIAIVDFTATSITDAAQVQIYRPVKNNILSNGSRNVIVSRVGNKEVDVVIPATSQIVSRNLSNAAYLQTPTIISANTLERFGNTIYVDTDGPHNLSVGDQILLDSFQARYAQNPIDLTAAANQPPVFTPATTGVTAQFPLTYATFTSGRPNFVGEWGTNTTLMDGTVLMTGGYTEIPFLAVTHAEVFIPGSLNTSTRDGKSLNYTWGTSSNMNVARAGHSATVLTDGTVLVVGGFNTSTGYLASTEIYNPTAHTWTNKASMSHARALHSATLLNDGRVMVVGGSDGSNVLASIEIYNPNSNTWSTLGNLTQLRCNHQAALLNDGTVLIDSGRTYNNAFTGTIGTIGYVNLTELINPSTSTISSVGNCNKATWGFPSCLMPDGRYIALHGGLGALNDPQFNYILWSNSLGTVWNTANSGPPAAPTVTNNSSDVLAPDGSANSVTKIVYPATTATNQYCLLQQTITADSNTVYNVSMYIRGPATNTFYFSVDGLSAGSNVFTSCAVEDDWKRFNLTFESIAGGSITVNVGSDTRPSFGPESPMAAQTVYVWEVMVTKSANPILPVIKTQGTIAFQTDSNYYLEIYDPVNTSWALCQGPMTFYGFGGTPDLLAQFGNGTAYYQANKNSIFLGFTANGGWFNYYINTGVLRYFNIDYAFHGAYYNWVHTSVSGTDIFVSGASSSNTGIVVGGLDYWYSGQINETLQTVASVVSPTTFSISSPSPKGSFAYMAAFNGRVTAFKAQPGLWSGPFAVDPSEGPVISNVFGLTSGSIFGGSNLKTLSLIDGSAFSDEPGYVCVGLGYSYQTDAIKYYGKQDINTLIIDFNYTFPKDVPVGASVSQLAYKGGWQDVPPEIGAFWLTASPTGRLAAIQTIQNIAAAGGITNIVVNYPSDYGLGAWGFPTINSAKLSDIVTVFSGDDTDLEVAEAEAGVVPV